MDDSVQTPHWGPRDLPDRQRTLRNAIDWSYDLLDAEEQIGLQRLAVFVGGFTLEAAEAVVDPFERFDNEVETIVSSLLDKSLLVRLNEPDEESRFGLLETVREYALEKLEDGGTSDQVRRAHAAYFVVLSDEMNEAKTARSRAVWARRVQIGAGQLPCKPNWILENDEIEWCLRLARGLYQTWQDADAMEGQRWLVRLLEHPSLRQPSAERAEVLWCVSGMMWVRGNTEASIETIRESLEIHRLLDNRRAQAITLNSLAIHLQSAERYSEAKAHFEESLEIWKELGDQLHYGRVLSNYAAVFRQEGDHDRARSLYQEAAATFEQIGDREGTAWELIHEGDMAREQGEGEHASNRYQQALSVFKDLENPWGISSALLDLGAAHLTKANSKRPKPSFVRH